MLFVGHKKTLDLKEVPQLASSESVRHVISDFEHNLESFTSTIPTDGVTSYALAKGLIFSAWKPIVLSALLTLVSALASYVGNYLINRFIRCLNGARRFAAEGSLLVLAFILSKHFEGLYDRHYIFRSQ